MWLAFESRNKRDITDITPKKHLSQIHSCYLSMCMHIQRSSNWIKCIESRSATRNGLRHLLPHQQQDHRLHPRFYIKNHHGNHLQEHLCTESERQSELNIWKRLTFRMELWFFPQSWLVTHPALHLHAIHVVIFPAGGPPGITECQVFWSPLWPATRSFVICKQEILESKKAKAWQRGKMQQQKGDRCQLNSPHFKRWTCLCQWPALEQQFLEPS